MNKETRDLLEKANDNLDKAYINIRIAISDLQDESVSTDLRVILLEIDKQKQEIEKLLYLPEDDPKGKAEPFGGTFMNFTSGEIFKYTTDEKSWRFSEANH